MPANTTRGWPYPLGTDRVMDGDDAIRAIAEKLDAVLGYGLCGGTVVLPITAANTPASVTVTFPVGRFATSPFVLVTSYVGGNASAITSYANTLSATGVNIVGVRDSGAAGWTVHWAALLPG